MEQYDDREQIEAARIEAEDVELLQERIDDLEHANALWEQRCARIEAEHEAMMAVLVEAITQLGGVITIAPNHRARDKRWTMTGPELVEGLQFRYRVTWEEDPR